MSTTKIIETSILAALLLVPQLNGCRTAAPVRGSAEGTRTATAQLGRPLARSLTPAVVHGWIEGRTASWRRLELNRPAAGLTAVRAVGRGAMLTIAGDNGGSEAGRLWLRGGAELHLGQDKDGTLRLYPRKGEVRISLFDLGLRAVVLQQDPRGGLHPRDISGQDLLVSAGGVLPTALWPRAADWTLAMIDATVPTSAGFGTLDTRGATGGRVSLELRTVKVRAFTSGDMAETRVEHVFYNDSDQQLEGTFRFPLPENAALIGMAMEINGRLMEGELVERNKARQTYESIVDAMQDPALLEWEQGNTFKLRVFPIEPRREKRVVLRYVAPLERTGVIDDSLSYRYDTAAAEMQRTIPRFSVTLDDRKLVEARDFVPGRSVTARVADDSGKAMREVRKDGIYTALRLRPDWSRLPRDQAAGRIPLLHPARRRRIPERPNRGARTGAPPRRGARTGIPRDLLLIVDTSRSALESRELCLQTLRALLADLRHTDRFLVLAADLTVRGHTPGFVPADAAQVRAATEFVEGIEPDGASDLGLALRTAGERLRERAGSEDRRAQVVYLGDGTPTWGETDDSALARIASENLGQAPLHAAILGQGANAALLRRLVASLGGRAVKPRTPRQVQRLALQLAGGVTVPRLRQVQIRAGEHDQLFPRQAPTLFLGEELVVLMRTPADKTPARQIVLEGVVNGKRFAQTFPATVVAPARHVAHRWAREQLVQLEAEGAAKDAVVQHSLQYGVMSRHTSFLVLESEEAYKRFKIARKNGPKPDAATPRVTGGDLESLGQAQANLSPDHFQPGDPEVRIPAPANARSVVVVFPFGETKVARYEQAIKAWTVRFLVAQDTPDGTYQIAVRITHHDGRVALLRLSYVVDTRAPTVRIGVRELRGGKGYVISARQVVTRHELVQEAHRDRIAAGAATISDDAGLSRYAAVVQDATRVEVQLPGGRVQRLWPYAMGKFAATWRPASRPTGKVTLKVVAVDKANNKNVFNVVYDPATGRVSR